jgi:hypothetical protein
MMLGGAMAVTACSFDDDPDICGFAYLRFI